MVISGTNELFIFGMKIRPLITEGTADSPVRDHGSGARARGFPAPVPQEQLDVITLHQDGDAWVSGSSKSERAAYREKPKVPAGEEPFLYDTSGKPRKSPRPSGQIIDIFI